MHEYARNNKKTQRNCKKLQETAINARHARMRETQEHARKYNKL